MRRAQLFRSCSARAHSGPAHGPARRRAGPWEGRSVRRRRGQAGGGRRRRREGPRGQTKPWRLMNGRRASARTVRGPHRAGAPPPEPGARGECAAGAGSSSATSSRPDPAVGAGLCRGSWPGSEAGPGVGAGVGGRAGVGGQAVAAPPRCCLRRARAGEGRRADAASRGLNPARAAHWAALSPAPGLPPVAALAPADSWRAAGPAGRSAPRHVTGQQDFVEETPEVVKVGAVPSAAAAGTTGVARAEGRAPWVPQARVCGARRAAFLRGPGGAGRGGGPEAVREEGLSGGGRRAGRSGRRLQPGTGAGGPSSSGRLAFCPRERTAVQMVFLKLLAGCVSLRGRSQAAHPGACSAVQGGS